MLDDRKNNREGKDWGAWYGRITEAVNQGELETALAICQEAIESLIRSGTLSDVSNAYHKLGMLTYKLGKYEQAASSYEEAIAIDEQTGDRLGSARSYNNLSAVFTAQGDFDASVNQLMASISIKKEFGDNAGLAASYQQMGVVATAQSDYSTAKDWYLQSLEITQSLCDEVNSIKTYISLKINANYRNDTLEAKMWADKAMASLDRANSAELAINLGREAEDQGMLLEARELYSKAVSLAEKRSDNVSKSLSLQYLGALSGIAGEYEFAQECFEEALTIDENRNAKDLAARSRKWLEWLEGK